MKVLIVTGTPGTGKTTLSIKLAKKLGFHYIDVNTIVRKYKLSEGYDRKRKTKIIDVKRLNRALVKEINNYGKLIQSNIKKIPVIKSNTKKFNKKNFNIIKKSIKKIKNIKNGVIIDSHLAHYLPEKYVDLCIVTKCDLKELERRLNKKKYSEAKIRENLDAEIFDICLNEAEENGHTVIVINTTKGINTKKISNKIGGFIDI